jgi:biofilm PGA synthesis N-glycosyltransferase PgaC
VNLKTANRPPASPPVRSSSSGGMARSFRPETTEPRPFRRWYLGTDVRFVVAFAAATVWMGASLWLSLPWIGSLGDHIGLVPAIVAVTLVALIPGHLVAFLAVALLFDRPPPLVAVHPTTPVTVLVAARNEAGTISETIDYLTAQDYDGDLQIMLIDNGSTDGTADIARAAAARAGRRLTVRHETRPGKNYALNNGLAAVETPIVITVDADTLLQKSAVRLLVARLQSSPPDVVAVAGHLMVRNSREGIWARLQVWDYLLGIAAVKRVQGMFQGTLVAQGAFSGYRTEALRTAGGWPAAIGEDIVLTWQLLRVGRVYHEPLALGFTGVPTTLRQLGRQRSRWARGMLEGIEAVPPWLQRRRTVRALAMIDLAIPFLDLAYVAVWLPGLVLAATGRFWVVGPMTLAVLPMTLALYGLLYRRQKRKVFRPLALRPRKDALAMVLFVTVYQAFMSVMSVRGYAQHLMRRKHTWK